MKKRFYLMTLAFFAIAAMSAIVSCTPHNTGEDGDRVPLPSPEVSVREAGETSFSIVWSPVAGAESYNYSCDWTGYRTENTADTLLSFSGLVPDSTYRVRVSAVPASDAVMFKESPAEEVSVYLESNGSDPEPDPDPEGDMFTIEMYDDPSSMVVIYTITPEDPQMLFYRDCFTDVQWSEMGGNSEDVWANALQGYMDFFGSSWLNMVAETGFVESFFDYVYDEHTYILVAGIDSLGNRITSVVDTVFYSGPVPPSDITFDVEARDVGISSAVVWVYPSNDDTYSMLLVESVSLKDYSEADIEDLISISYGDYINDGHVYSGEMNMTYREGQLEPDTEYTVLVFGWNTALSTDVTTYSFRTEKASGSSDLTFEWEMEILGPTQIHVVVTPSDPASQYMVVPMPDYDYEEFGSDINAYVEYVTMGMITPYEYARMFAHTGTTDRVFNDWDDGIYPGSSYMFFAVGLDLDNESETVSFYEPQFYGEMVTTPTE